MVSNKNYVGFINTNGKIIVLIKYDIHYHPKDFKDGSTIVKLKNINKIIDVNGEILINTKPDNTYFLCKDKEGKRIYSIDSNKYNYKGGLIKNDMPIRN